MFHSFNVKNNRNSYFIRWYKYYEVKYKNIEVQKMRHQQATALQVANEGPAIYGHKLVKKWLQNGESVIISCGTWDPTTDPMSAFEGRWQAFFSSTLKYTLHYWNMAHNVRIINLTKSKAGGVGIEPTTVWLWNRHSNHLTKSPGCQPSS